MFLIIPSHHQGYKYKRTRRQAGRSNKQSQSHSNREPEAENGRQSRTPVWVEIRRIILASGSHAGRGTEAGRPDACRGMETEVGTERLGDRKAIIDAGTWAGRRGAKGGRQAGRGSQREAG
jgi:hypothetical protein